MDGRVEGALEKSPLTSAFLFRSTIDGDCFLSFSRFALVHAAMELFV